MEKEEDKVKVISEEKKCNSIKGEAGRNEWE